MKNLNLIWHQLFTNSNVNQGNNSNNSAKTAIAIDVRTAEQLKPKSKQSSSTTALDAFQRKPKLESSNCSSILNRPHSIDFSSNNHYHQFITKQQPQPPSTKQLQEGKFKNSRKKLLRRLTSLYHRPSSSVFDSTSSSSLSGSSTSTGSSIDSLSSCSAYSLFYYGQNSAVGHENVPQRRAISCIDINDTSINNINKLSSSSPSTTKTTTVTTTTTSTTTAAAAVNSPKTIETPAKRLQSFAPSTTAQSLSSLCVSPPSSPSKPHYKHCRCNACLFGFNLSSLKIDIIREEDEEEGEENENEENNQITQNNNKDNSLEQEKQKETKKGKDNLAKMFDSKKIPIRPARHRKQLDRIEPFHKDDDLKLYWQEPKQTLYMAKEAEDALSRHSIINNNNNDTGSSTSSNNSDGVECRKSLASNFLRVNNNLRSSCPPSSRRRKSTDNLRVKSASQNANHVIGSHNDDRNSLVDAINTKFNAVRKSWLSSFFNSFNSKVINFQFCLLSFSI